MKDDWLIVSALLFFCALIVDAREHVTPSKIPQWVLNGILAVETQSYYEDDGIVYVNRKRGRAGERGPFQMKRIAFDQVKERGERFEDLSRDPIFAEYMACKYLAWLYNGPARLNWQLTIEMYNAGPGGRSRQYFYAVRREGQ